MTDEKENLDAVMRRIQKLLAIAGDDRANPAEAAAAAGMAERIMAKYQLEHADVIASQLNKGEGMTDEEVVVTAKTNGTKVEKVPVWASMIAFQLGRLHTCGSLNSIAKDGQACVRFMGYTADVVVASWTLVYLVATVNRLCVAYRKHPTYIYDGRSAMHSYRVGVTTAIINSISTIVFEREKERAMAEHTGRALVLIKTDAVAEKYGKSAVTGKMVKYKNKHASSFTDGIVDGRKVDVNVRPLEGSKPSEGLNLLTR